MPKQDAERRARELRRAAGQELPVDVDAIARAHDIDIRRQPFEDEVAGMLVIKDGQTIIGVNDTHHPNRQRFTIAHELGHHILRHHENFHIDLASSTAHGESANYSWRDERAANDFAAELLMPASMVVAAARVHPTVQVLAKQFEVSREAMGFRLINLGLK